MPCAPCLSGENYEGTLEKLARARSGDKQARDELTEENLPLVHYVAKRFRDRGVEYEDLIRTYAAENNIPPAYVASVILAESSYRPEVVSYADARGLMQILPSTAKWIAGKFDEEYVEGCLFDPETNIKYGCWYLGFLMNRYDGDMECSSSAYHAGQGTVDKWLKDPAISADGKTLDNIPSEATGTYVSRILKYYEKYEEIYG